MVESWATLTLMTYFKQQNLSVVGMKPVASGCEKIDGKWLNSDALAIQQHGSIPLNYSLINPYAYELPMSPHLAGKKNPVDLETIFTNFQKLQNLADIVVVEGAGGWYAPLNDNETIANLAEKLNVPIILVVAIKLGCINHALLTSEAIKHSGLNCVGWIAVCNDANFACVDLTIESLVARLQVPLIGILPYSETTDFENGTRQIQFDFD